MIKYLNQADILEKKPRLKLYPNHYYYVSENKRIWNSDIRGTAKRDGRGWYVEGREKP